MEFSPRLDEPALPLGKLPSQNLDRINRIDRHELLIVGMEVRSMVRIARLDKHPNDDSEEAADFRHAERNRLQGVFSRRVSAQEENLESRQRGRRHFGVGDPAPAYAPSAAAFCAFDCAMIFSCTPCGTSE